MFLSKLPIITIKIEIEKVVFMVFMVFIQKTYYLRNNQSLSV